PQQSLNYFEFHVNSSSFDYDDIENPNWTPQDQKVSASFVLHLILISQVISFILCGEEFFRS
ncbi:hypothetical protein ACJBY9_10380, partial [Streptococcus suis]